MSVCQPVTNLPTNVGGKYVACVAHNFPKAQEEAAEAIGLICTGNYFLFQLTEGNAYDLAWALDQFIAHEEVYLVWDEKTCKAVLTLVTPTAQCDFLPMVRIKMHLPPADYAAAQVLIQEYANAYQQSPEGKSRGKGVEGQT